MKTIYTTLTLLLSLITLSAQSSLEKREILVEKTYSDEIYQVEPIFDYASIRIPDKVSALDIDNQLIPISPFTPDLDVTIRPLAYNHDVQNKLKRGFLKLDRGTLNPLFAHGGYTYSAPNYFNISAHGGYDYREESPTPNKLIRDIEGNLDIDYYLNKELKTTLSVGYNRSSYGLYANPLLELDSQLGYDDIEVSLGLESIRTTPDHWNYRGHVQLDTWNSRTSETKERTVSTLGELSYMINNTWDISLSPEVRWTQSEVLGDNTSLHGSLNLSFDQSRFYANTGIRLDHYNGATRLWPDLDLRWKTQDGVDIYIRSEASTDLWGGRYITEINPYSSFQNLESDNRTLVYTRSLQSKVDAKLPNQFDLVFSASFADTKDDLNFVRSDEERALFEIEEVDYQKLSITADVTRPLMSGHIIPGLLIRYDRYDVKSGRLYNRPTFLVKPHIDSKLLSDKLSIGIEGLFHNAVVYQETLDTEITSGWRTQLSAQISYQLLDILSIQLDADNILADDFELWQGYDVFGRNLSAGVLFKF